ncbi:MAG: CoA-binding protein [Candidatus Bathyarchaeota archaeon]|nr:CoA-binding protein [Candidatus Bathyarchaeota archaeon]
MMNEELIKGFLNKKNIFSVVGASRDPKKYGYQVYKDLKEAGYEVYPINPNAEKVLGDRCYPDLGDLPIKPDVVDVVVPPKVTEKIVKACKRLGITKVWMQPGSESETAIKFCDENGIDVVHGVCVMVERRGRA